MCHQIQQDTSYLGGVLCPTKPLDIRALTEAKRDVVLIGEILVVNRFCADNRSAETNKLFSLSSWKVGVCAWN